MKPLDKLRQQIDVSAHRVGAFEDDIAELEITGAPGALQWKRQRLAAESAHLSELRSRLRRQKRRQAAAVLAW